MATHYQNMGGTPLGHKTPHCDRNLWPHHQNYRAGVTNHYRVTWQAKTGPDLTMNAPSELNFEDMLRIRLEVLRREHRDLDEAIYALETAGRPDQLTLRRLKKQKLFLKDQIVKFEDQLIPDIIA